jgi:hypothetical protein
MDNKERYLWIGVLILACLFCDRKMSQVESLELLNQHDQLNRQIQSDQINELTLKLNELDSIQYSQGFEDGKTHAMLAVIHDESLYGYAEGYHAAIDQLSKEMSSDEIKSQVTAYLDSLMKRVSKNKEEKQNGN